MELKIKRIFHRKLWYRVRYQNENKPKYYLHIIIRTRRYFHNNYYLNTERKRFGNIKFCLRFIETLVLELALFLGLWVGHFIT